MNIGLYMGSEGIRAEQRSSRAHDPFSFDDVEYNKMSFPFLSRAALYVTEKSQCNLKVSKKDSLS